MISIELVSYRRAPENSAASLPQPALRALLANLIDYAGTFPPASLACTDAFRNFEEYRKGPYSWALGRCVISAADLDVLSPERTGPFTVLATKDHPRAESIEAKSLVETVKPFYWECSSDGLPAVREAGAFTKIRTGGVTPDSIPEIEQLARFLRCCAELRLPFKATAGLHHPLRSSQPLTYEPDAPKAIMHGFINVFVAASFAWSGCTEIEDVLAETDGAAFRFDERAHWRDWSLSIEQIQSARREFAHSFGSCSFCEPLDGLRELGWL